MSRTDHATSARRAINIADAIIEGQAMSPHELAGIELAKGQIDATLALVEQQRIANLIALSGYVDCDIPDDLNGIAHAALVALKGQVTELRIEVQS